MNTTQEHPTSREHILGPLSDIPKGEGREYALGGDFIAVFHTRAGAIYATQALCPHRQGPLIDGLVGGTTLLCPFHAWKFNLATGEALLGDCGLKTYPIRTDSAGRLVLTLRDAPP